MPHYLHFYLLKLRKTMQVVPFGSIEKFSSTIRQLTKTACYEARKEITNGGSVPVHELDLPIFECILTEKIHGTQGAASFNKSDGLWYQSRKRILSATHDNAGMRCAQLPNDQYWIDTIINLADYNDVDLAKDTITIFFEWCGGNIQQKSAVSGLEKRAIIFQHAKVAVGNPGDDDSNYWIETRIGGQKWLSSAEIGIYNIMNFERYSAKLDMNNPNELSNSIMELILSLEESSPVGEYFGIKDNILEGYVGTVAAYGQVFRFKIKGKQHESTIKGLKRFAKPVAQITPEQRKARTALTNLLIPDWRLVQGWQELHGIGHSLDTPRPQLIGKFISWVMADIKKECQGIIDEHHPVTLRDVSRDIVLISKTAYLKLLENYDPLTDVQATLETLQRESYDKTMESLYS